MFRSIYQLIHLTITRLFLRISLKKEDYNEPIKMMKTLQELLVDSKHLNEDLTKGPVPVQHKITKELVFSYVSNRHKQYGDDYYIQVAKEWVKDDK